MSIYDQWIAAKSAEANAIRDRRDIEDTLVTELKISESLDGTENFAIDGYKVKVVGRMNRKIDADMLQELAAESGLQDHLGRLFRWKPEINASAWRSAEQSITAPLLAAITTTPGRPSFSIEKE